METCNRMWEEWVPNPDGKLELKCTNKNCKLFDHCGRNNYQAVADCKGCFAVLMPACDKQIPCCLCMTEVCYARVPCERGII